MTSLQLFMAFFCFASVIMGHPCGSGNLRTIMQNAQTLAQKGDLSGAATCIHHAVAEGGSRPPLVLDAAYALHQIGEVEGALKYYNIAIAAGADKDGQVMFQAGNCLAALERYTEALPIYRSVVSRLPTLAPAWTNLGNVEKLLELHDDALQSYQRAFALDDSNADVSFNIGVLLSQRGDYESAITNLQRAVSMQPNDEEYNFAFFDSMLRARRRESAIQGFRHMLRLWPKNAKIEFALASALLQHGATRAGVSQLRVATAPRPSSTCVIPRLRDAIHNAIHNRQVVKDVNCVFEEDEVVKLAAAASLIWEHDRSLGVKVLGLAPWSRLSAAGHRRLGVGYYDVREYERARIHLEAAVAGGQRVAVAKLIDVLQTVCAWNAVSTHMNVLESALWNHVRGGDEARDAADNQLFESLQANDGLYLGLHPALLLHLARRQSLSSINSTRAVIRPVKWWLNAVDDTVAVNLAVAPFLQQGWGTDRLRIAYLTSDLKRSHPVGQLLLPLLQAHSVDAVSVRCYSNRAQRLEGSPPEWVAAVQAACGGAVHHVADVGDTELAAKINTERPHIVVNVNGWSGYDRNAVLSVRVAPVQVSYLGFAGTMGASFIDYLVSDRVATPPEYQDFTMEKVTYMPGTYHFLGHAATFPRPPTPADDGIIDSLAHGATSETRSDQRLPRRSIEGSSVLACFSRAKKLDAATFLGWSRVLRRSPSSVLWMTQIGLTVEAEHRLVAKMASNGVDPSRVIFVQPFDWDHHIMAKARADVVLDTPVYNGHTSTGDALWAAAPVVTLPGESMAARVSASIALAAGFIAGTARTHDDYIDIASAMASQPARLSHLRTGIVSSRASSWAFDIDRYVRHWETALRLEAEVSLWSQRMHVVVAACES